MKRLKLKYPPKFILLWVARNYLNEVEFKKLLDKVYPCKSDRKFYKVFMANFDIEILRRKQIVWQDIWIYNYLLYDCKDKLPKNQLIYNYEKEFVIPTEETLKELKYLLSE